MRYVFVLFFILTPALARAELIDYSSGKFTVATEQVTSSDLQDRLNKAKANVGQVTERCQAEIASAYTELDAVQKDVDIATAVEAGATLEEAKTPVKPKPIVVDEGIYP